MVEGWVGLGLGCRSVVCNKENRVLRIEKVHEGRKFYLGVYSRRRRETREEEWLS